MFIVNISYLKDLDTVNQYLEAHRAFLDQCIAKNYLLVTGPKEPRTGGILIALLDDQAELENILSQDPYLLNHVAKYEYIKFKPVKYHPALNSLNLKA